MSTHSYEGDCYMSSTAPRHSSCPSTGEYLNIFEHIHSIKCYSEVKKKTIGTEAGEIYE